MNQATNRFYGTVSRMAFLATGTFIACAAIGDFIAPFIPLLITVIGSLIAGFLVRSIFVRLLNKRLVSSYRYTEAQAHTPDDTQSHINAPPDSLAMYRSLLGLGPRFTGEELKTAYRNAAAVYHPDRYAAAARKERENAEVLMKKVNEAYECLKTAAI